MVPTASPSAPPAPDRALPGERVAGRYRRLERLGAGGMSVVHRARDESTGREVALKELVLPPAGAKRRSLEALFEREYHTLARLRHPRIIEVHDYGLAPSGPYYTMELLEGGDLQRAPLPYREACRHLRDVASSLALLHAQRLLYRDVSPRNVRLTRDGRAKLIDFGALTGFGRASELVGTAPFVAPEVLQRRALDQRTDLYALGALAYYVLTGRHAYPAGHIQDLPPLWRRAPEPPSRFAPDVPPALDQLVASMMDLDVLARPSHAAAVIDALTAIAGLPAEEHELAANSYLLSSRLVGRERERVWVKARIGAALKGAGTEIVVEGPPGIGRTRLLHDLCLDARLEGMTALEVDAQAVPGAFGVAAAIAEQLMTVCPEQALRRAEPQAGVIAHLVPELARKLGREVPPLPDDPHQRGLLLQSALVGWWLDVARGRPLLIAIDNLQRADFNSAALLAALAHGGRSLGVVLIAALRSGDPVVAPDPVQALRRRASSVKLGGLNRAAYEEIVRSLFGDVENTGRVARLLYERSAGNPQQCMDLAALLVKKQVAKYVGGTWVLPLEVSAGELPRRHDELFAARLAELSAAARALVEDLSVHSAPIALELCLSAAAAHGERGPYALLDELVAEQILLADGVSYRFAQETLRCAALAGLGDARRRGAHQRAARALLAAAGEDPALRARAAHHLLEAGEQSRGADLLAASTLAVLKTHGVPQSVEQLVSALEAALSVYERERRSEHEIARLLLPLMSLAFFSSNWRLTAQHSERAVELGLRITGLSLAHKLRPLLGRPIALALGLGWAALGFLRRRRLGSSLIETISSLCALVPTAIGVHNICFDVPRSLRLLELIEPLKLFGHDAVPPLIYEFARAQTIAVQGRELEAIEISARLCQRFHEPEVVKLLGEVHWKALYGGLLYTQAVLRCYGLGTHALELAREMEELGVTVWAMAADQVRLLHHALRGESERVEHYRERVELFAVQGSTTWQVDMFWPALMLNSNVLCGDTLAVRRTWEQVARRVQDVPSLASVVGEAEAAYLALRGETKPAIERYASLLPTFVPRAWPAWMTLRAYFAQALRSDGQHERAKQLVLEAIAAAPSDDRQVAALFFELRRQLALAEVDLGRASVGLAMVDELLERYAEGNNPLIVGLLHEAGCEAALALRDSAAFSRHLSQLELRFRPTRNPALIRRIDPLIKRARDAGMLATLSVSHGALVGAGAAGGDAADACTRVLLHLMEHARARAGYLYVLDGQVLRLVAAKGPADPPAELTSRLQLQLERAPFELIAASEAGSAHHGPSTQRPPAASESYESDAEQSTVFVESLHPAPADDDHHVVILRARRNGAPVVAGGVILARELSSQLELDASFLETAADALLDAQRAAS